MESGEARNQRRNSKESSKRFRVACVISPNKVRRSKLIIQEKKNREKPADESNYHNQTVNTVRTLKRGQNFEYALH